MTPSFEQIWHEFSEPLRQFIQKRVSDPVLTQKEYAERLGVSLSGAKSRVQRGREQLKEMLLECCRFEFDRRGHAFHCEPRRADACPECASPSPHQPPR